MRPKSNNIFGLFLGIFVILAGLILTLFRHWEFSGESWGYWLFARIFAETGRFIVLDRSPLYVLYLNLFRGLGYPAAVVVEYIVTSLIVSVVLIIFLRRYIGTFLASFGVFLWLPFLQTAEPLLQKLTLALSCIAVMLREVKNNRFYFSVSYGLLLCAYAMRSTYIIFIIVFAVWDSMRIFRQKRLKGFLAALRPQRNDWPVFAALALLIWFNVMPSVHPWNNGWFATAKWFPAQKSRLVDASFIQHYNWQYIYDKYGSFKDKDFYFTNQEVFDGATSMIGAMRANPRFVAIQIARNIKRFFCTVASLTAWPRFLYEESVAEGYFYYAIVLLFTIPFVFAVFYGALRSSRSKNMTLFLAVNIFLAATTIIFLPKARYMHPLIPLLILSAFWYGKFAGAIFEKSQLLKQKLSKAFGMGVSIFFIAFFSTGLADWTQITKDFVNDIRKKEVKVMDRRKNSFNTLIRQVPPLLCNCRGILLLEHRFFGAFTDIALSKIYDVWQIPPFGQLGGSDYRGLRPEHIDCIVVSPSLAKGIGFATNHQIRYQNYIMPYIRRLKNMGALTHNIKGFGQVIVLSPDNYKGEQ